MSRNRFFSFFQFFSGFSGFSGFFRFFRFFQVFSGFVRFFQVLSGFVRFCQVYHGFGLKTVKTISVTDSKSVYGFRCIYAAVKITVFHRKCESSNANLTLYHAKTVIIMPSKSVILRVKCQFTQVFWALFGLATYSNVTVPYVRT